MIAKLNLYGWHSRVEENIVKHIRAGSKTRNICTRSKSVSLFIGKDDMVEVYVVQKGCSIT